MYEETDDDHDDDDQPSRTAIDYPYPSPPLLPLVSASSYEYAKTILTLMTKEKHPDGKVLIIGGEKDLTVFFLARRAPILMLAFSIYYLYRNSLFLSRFAVDGFTIYVSIQLVFLLSLRQAGLPTSLTSPPPSKALSLPCKGSRTS